MSAVFEGILASLISYGVSQTGPDFSVFEDFADIDLHTVEEDVEVSAADQDLEETVLDLDQVPEGDEHEVDLEDSYEVDVEDGHEVNVEDVPPGAGGGLCAALNDLLAWSRLLSAALASAIACCGDVTRGVYTLVTLIVSFLMLIFYYMQKLQTPNVTNNSLRMVFTIVMFALFIPFVVLLLSSRCKRFRSLLFHCCKTDRIWVCVVFWQKITCWWLANLIIAMWIFYKYIDFTFGTRPWRHLRLDLWSIFGQGPRRVLEVCILCYIIVCSGALVRLIDVGKMKTGLRENPTNSWARTDRLKDISDKVLRCVRKRQRYWAVALMSFAFAGFVSIILLMHSSNENFSLLNELDYVGSECIFGSNCNIDGVARQHNFMMTMMHWCNEEQPLRERLGLCQKCDQSRAATWVNEMTKNYSQDFKQFTCTHEESERFICSFGACANCTCGANLRELRQEQSTYNFGLQVLLTITVAVLVGFPLVRYWKPCGCGSCRFNRRINLSDSSIPLTSRAALPGGFNIGETIYALRSLRTKQQGTEIVKPGDEAKVIGSATESPELKIKVRFTNPRAGHTWPLNVLLTDVAREPKIHQFRIGETVYATNLVERDGEEIAKLGEPGRVIGLAVRDPEQSILVKFTRRPKYDCVLLTEVNPQATRPVVGAQVEVIAGAASPALQQWRHKDYIGWIGKVLKDEKGEAPGEGFFLVGFLNGDEVRCGEASIRLIQPEEEETRNQATAASIQTHDHVTDQAQIHDEYKCGETVYATKPIEIDGRVIAMMGDPAKVIGLPGTRITVEFAKRRYQYDVLPTEVSSFRFFEHPGQLGSHDIAKKVVTVEKAKMLALTFDGHSCQDCQGFTFAGPLSDQPVETCFKNVWNLKAEVTGWTSFRKDRPMTIREILDKFVAQRGEAATNARERQAAEAKAKSDMITRYPNIKVEKIIDYWMEVRKQPGIGWQVHYRFCSEGTGNIRRTTAEDIASLVVGAPQALRVSGCWHSEVDGTYEIALDAKCFYKGYPIWRKNALDAPNCMVLYMGENNSWKIGKPKHIEKGSYYVRTNEKEKGYPNDLVWGVTDKAHFVPHDDVLVVARPPLDHFSPLAKEVHNLEWSGR